MPKKLERNLEREATRRGYTGRQRDRFVFGTMNNIKKRRARRRG